MDANIVAAIISAAASIITTIIAVRAQHKNKQFENVGLTTTVIQQPPRSSALRTLLWIVAGLFAISFLVNLNTSITSPPIIPAAYCCDGYGVRRCPLINPVPAGSYCFCPGQGSGIACP